MTDAAKKLRDLFAEPVVITVGGQPLSVTPFKVGLIPKILQLAEPFLGELVNLRDGGTLEVRVLQLIARHGERVFDLVALLVNKPRAWLDGLRPDELPNLCVTVFEVNEDFFTRSFLPACKSAWSRTTGRWSSRMTPSVPPAESPGLMPSSGSSNADTDGATSVGTASAS